MLRFVLQITKSLLLHTLSILEKSSIVKRMADGLEVTLNDIRSCDEAKGSYVAIY